MIKSHDAHDVRIGFFVAEWVLDIVCVIFTEDRSGSYCRKKIMFPCKTVHTSRLLDSSLVPYL